jgi:uncharacterized membrane protein YoaK (UPF0700 family)
MSLFGEPPEEWLSLSLAFVGGYGDAAGLVLAKTFTGHITGNLVLAAVSIAAIDWRIALSRLSAIVSFLAGILLSVAFARLMAARRWPALLPTAFAVEVILVMAGSFALMFHAAAGTEIFVLCLSLALGLQNGIFRRAGGISVHTTFLTGMITGLMVTRAEKFLSGMTAGAPSAHDVKSRLLCGIWASFFLGAATGAALVFRFKAAGMLGLVVVLTVLIVCDSIAARPAPLAS